MIFTVTNATGTVSTGTSGNDRYHVFTGNGTLHVTQLGTVPTISYICVAGGGGGGTPPGPQPGNNANTLYPGGGGQGAIYVTGSAPWPPLYFATSAEQSTGSGGGGAGNGGAGGPGPGPCGEYKGDAGGGIGGPPSVAPSPSSMPRLPA